MRLTEKVLCFQRGCWPWSNLWEDLWVVIDGFLASQRLGPDIEARFLDQFEPRLTNMVERFEYRGMPFESFLRRSLRLQLRTAYQDIRQEKRLFQLAVAESPGGYSLDPQPDFEPVQATAEHRTFRELAVKDRRYVIAALKNCAHLDDRMCQALAGQLALSPEWLLECRDRLFRSIQAKLEAKQHLGIRLARLCHDLDDDPDGRRQERIAKLRQRFADCQIYPRHQTIAAVLGIPKGTVDSTLFYIRRTLAADSHDC